MAKDATLGGRVRWSPAAIEKETLKRVTVLGSWSNGVPRGHSIQYTQYIVGAGKRMAMDWF